MATVRAWTGCEAAILRTALRLSVRAFAEHLGVAVRTVANWESKGAEIRPLPDMQAILDTALARANAEARERFTMALEVSSPPEFNGTVELHARLTRTAAALDADLVELFEQQTQAFRLLDRRLGAGRLLTQTEAHVHQMADMLTYTLAGSYRAALGAALAEACALAGWQALDLGRADKAWALHETAKAAALESGDPAVLAHVTAQQAYALLDIDQPADAVHQVRHAHETAGSRIPAALRAWLWAAEAEANACAGDEAAARTALDRATGLGRECTADELPYLAVDEVHLTRWRGHCLARLGAADAMDDLTLALESLDPSFVRATAGLHCDLAIAHAARNELDTAREHAQQAAQLADATMSVRQRRRIRQLVAR